MSRPDDLRAFGDSAQALEAQIADAEARGTPVPPEAHAMLESLRQLSRAIDDLQASLGVEAPADGSADARAAAGADDGAVGAASPETTTEGTTDGGTAVGDAPDAVPSPS
jgi:hypothetical protein